MNREIKFRVWHGKNKEMIYPSESFTWTLSLCGEIFKNCGGSIKDKENCALQQFTGLLDKNGREIYEGDIVHIWGEDFEGNIGEHLFHQIGPIEVLEYGPSVRYVEKMQFNSEFGPSSSTLANYKNRFVIGNIFENPELLEN